MRSYFKKLCLVLLVVLPLVAHGAITFVAAGALGDSDALVGTTGQLAALPAGSAQNDFCIIYSHRNDNISDFDTPSGWTRQTVLDGVETGPQDLSTAIFTKKLGASESDVTVTHADTGAEQWVTVMLCYRGVDQTTPFDVTPVSGHYSDMVFDKATPNVDAFPNIVTVTDGAMVIALEAITHNDITSTTDPSGYTNRVTHIDFTCADCNMRQIQIWDAIKATAGSETPPAAAYTSSATVAESVQATIALRPAVGGGGVTEIFTMQDLSKGFGPHKSQQLGGVLEQ